MSEHARPPPPHPKPIGGDGSDGDKAMLFPEKSSRPRRARLYAGRAWLYAGRERLLLEERGYMAEEHSYMREERGNIAEEHGYMPEECGYMPQEHGYIDLFWNDFSGHICPSTHVHTNQVAHALRSDQFVTYFTYLV